MPRRRWWLALTSIWVLGTLADRLWLQLDQRLPAWDQADYLNSAVDHGRALGLLPAGGWQGWDALLDLSPKIPPLASLVNGTVMAIAGDSADQASWALALWQALLLLVVGCWGRQLLGPGFGLLAASLTTLSPALAALRVDFTLDLPLAATATLALWLLGRWQAPDTEGGRWSQAIAAALAVAAAVLVKQSALLVLLAPCLWAALQGLRQRGRRLQVLVALATVLGLCLPWLRHNWITTIGGTNRAVLEAATTEGDPDPFSLASLLWYPRLLPQQLGWISLSLGLLGGGLAALQRWRQPPQSPRQSPGQTSLVLPSGWAWLIGCTLSGWLITTLSPNKDPRYLAPVLPLLVLLLAGGWWQLFVSARRRWGTPLGGGLLGIGLLAAGVSTTVGQSQAIERREGAPIGAITAAIRRQAQDAPVTVVVVPTSKDLNQHSFTHAGRRNGGRIVGRETGKQRREHALILRQASWLLLATGDQGTKRKASRRLGAQVRSDPRFALAASWPWSEGRQLELWQRRAQAPSPERFDTSFIRLAQGLEAGPSGLAAVFDAIGPQHQLDGHFLYQKRVQAWAEARLSSQPNDDEALWSLALLAVLQNRPVTADRWFSRLEGLHPTNPWPSAYRSVVLLAGWNPWRSHAVAAKAAARAATQQHQPVLEALADLSGALSGRPASLRGSFRSLPIAIEEVTRNLESAAKQP